MTRARTPGARTTRAPRATRATNSETDTSARIVPGQSVAEMPRIRNAKLPKPTTVRAPARADLDTARVTDLLADTYTFRRSRTGVCVVDGYGIVVRVERGRLVVADGTGAHRREQRYGRATHGLRRLLIIGHTGTITLDAIRWLADTRVPWTQLDNDGTPLATATGDYVTDGRLRRAQATALDNPTGLDVTRLLLVDKLRGQRVLLDRLPATPTAEAQLDDAITRAETCGTIAELLTAEARGAAAYWSAWATLPVTFAPRDRAKIPDHWHTVGPRGSPITGTSRRFAATPAHALLNYLYALLAAETLIACHTLGLDPTLGFFHADARSRNSLVYDLMEPGRPAIDAYLLDLLDAHIFRAVDFTETRQGACRILAPLTHVLADTTASWAGTIAPIAERVVRTLEGRSGSPSRRGTTPLTQANRRARSTTPTKSRRTVEPPKGCRECGTPVANNQRALCDNCLADSRTETLDKMRNVGPRALDAWRASADPDTRRRAYAAGTATKAEQRRARRHDGPITLDDYRNRIQPALAALTVEQIMTATGLSKLYAMRIRGGSRTPDPRHWDNLAALVVT
jgi:CRISPR-associated endonuclease Cas1